MRVCPRCNAIFKAQVLSCSSDGTTLIDRQDDPHLSSALGRFLLETLIAEGVTGRIYRSGDAAVRILYGDFGSQELIVKRMFKDVEVAKELQHPNVARILDAGTDDGSTWIAWELARGQTLETLVAAEGSLSLERVGSICAQIAAALAEAHEAEILHRNLSPSNVMVSPKGKRDAVKVLDFGLASLARSSQALRFRTRRDYSAPEALRPSGASKAGDVYSLGLIAKEMMSKTGNGQSELGALFAAMIEQDPKQRPQTGRDVLSRLDDLGYSPIAFPSAKKEKVGMAISEDLQSDLSADGLVLVGAQKVEAAEMTEPNVTPDLLAIEEGLVVVSNAPAPGPTTYVYSGTAPEATTREEIDIEESRRKLGFLENARPRREQKAKETKELTRKSLLPHGPVLEKVRTPGNGAAQIEISSPEPPTQLMDDLLPVREMTNPGIEVTASQMIDEIEMLESFDVEPMSDDPGGVTEEQPIPLPGANLQDPAERAPAPVDPAETPPPTLLSAAELSEPRAIGGVQRLPAEHGERSKVAVRENPGARPYDGPRGFRPKGSWPTEDLVLPSKHGASMPSGFGEDLQRAPTAVIRARGVFSSEPDVPDRPGLMNARETEIIRPRSPSELGGRAETLPIDRSNTVVDPAEGPASMSAELRVKPRRSLIPIAAGAVILTIAAAAIALPRLDPERSSAIRRPVLIEAQPDQVEEKPQDMAAVDPLPEGDAPEKEPEVAKAVEEKPLAVEEPKAELEKPKAEVEEPKAEVEKPKVDKPKADKPKADKPKADKPKEASKSRVVEVLPEGDDPAEKTSKKREKKKQARKRSSAKTEAKKEQPEKLERGTLIDPFAE